MHALADGLDQQYGGLSPHYNTWIHWRGHDHDPLVLILMARAAAQLEWHVKKSGLRGKHKRTE